MVNAVGSSDFEDPVHNYSTSSLFPRTFRASTDPHQNSSNDTSSIDSIHSCPKSMALRSPKQLLEQAKAVLDRGSKLLNSNLTSRVPFEENKNEDVAAEAGKDEGNLPKSVRFDSKADLSQIMESSEQISLLMRRMSQPNPSHDPFLALDKDLSPARNPCIDKQFDQALRSPKQLLEQGKELIEQAKAVLDRGSKLLNSNLTSRVPFEENKNEDVAAEAGKDEGNLPKSVRFDSKADLSQIMESSERISLLMRRMSQPNRSHDPFLALDKDLSLVRNPCIDKQFDQVEMEKGLSISENLKSLHEDDSTAGNMGSCQVVADDSTRPVDKYVIEFSSALGVGMDVHSNGLHGEFEANAGASNGDEMIIDDEYISLDTHSNAPTNTPNNFEDSAGDMLLQEAVASAQPDINNEDISLEDLNNSLHKFDQPSSASIEDIAMDGPEDPDAGPEQHIEKIQDCSRTLFDQKAKPSKATKRPSKEPKRKENSRRQCLAAAGMKWESGVRRSTRMRPLEYRKGERFLYGRKHQTGSLLIWS